MGSLHISRPGTPVVEHNALDEDIADLAVAIDAEFRTNGGIWISVADINADTSTLTWCPASDTTVVFSFRSADMPADAAVLARVQPG